MSKYYKKAEESMKKYLWMMLLTVLLLSLTPTAVSEAGLVTTSKGIRYEKSDGTYLRKTWKRCKGKYYYFKWNGYAATTQWVGKYYVNKKGQRVISDWVGSRFFDAKGKQVTSKALNLSSPSAILIDADSGKIIYKKKASTKRPNASTTKIMTAILALENRKMDDVVTFSEYAASREAVKLYASAGDQYYLGDLMYAMLLPSYNDVATAIAEHIGGSVPGFAEMMNQKAEEIGCKNTTFVTPSGLDEGNHGTTAADLAKIARYAYNIKTFRKIVKTQYYSFSCISNGNSHTVYTTDQLLGSLSGLKGMKTGYTSKAGYCFVGVLKRNGKTYISVVLGAPDSESRWSDTRKLLEFGVANY